MISALRQGQNGNQILAILNSITSDVGEVVDTQPVDGFVTLPGEYVNANPTLEEIAFWMCQL